MKQFLSILLCIFLFVNLFTACSQPFQNNVNLTVSEDEQQYSLVARYPEDNTEKVENYLNQKIGDKNNFSFRNAYIDAQLTLDDGTKMYVKSNPGSLKIKLNKEENSAASYKEVKALGEGFKPFLNKDK